MTSVVTTVAGGDAANTLPGQARATLDIRSSVPSDLEQPLPLLTAGGPTTGSAIEVEDRGTWPPMPRQPAAGGGGGGHRHRARPGDRPRALGRRLGRLLDGAMGVPSLDGLGPVGGRDHTPDEWIEIETLEPRIELAARLIERRR